tara:strand:+ start:616 stop:888 length:273 start_codon:yes stop_codon:yes gene_type:complete
MESFRSFITAAQKTKKCPDGYRFDKRLQVCVPIGVTRYYPYFGGRNGDNNQQTDTSNNDGQNGNGSNGNGGNGSNGGDNNSGNGNGGNGS